jgi:3'(2'), 5'-bisphosphate nucleotidase
VLCFAVDGCGAWEIDGARLDFAGARRLAPCTDDDGSDIRICLSFESGHADTGQLDAVLTHLDVAHRPLRLDSQCKYAAVARGQADAYLRIPSGAAYSEWIWDHAAGVAIGEEAGATITDLLGRPLDFGCGRKLSQNRGILSARPWAHARMLSAAMRSGACGPAAHPAIIRS